MIPMIRQTDRRTGLMLCQKKTLFKNGLAAHDEHRINLSNYVGACTDIPCVRVYLSLGSGTAGPAVAKSLLVQTATILRGHSSHDETGLLAASTIVNITNISGRGPSKCCQLVGTRKKFLFFSPSVVRLLLS
jgi:hypothetical protein